MIKILGKNTILRSVSIQDAEFILELRTNKELGRYLHPVNNSVEEQKAWLEKYFIREKRNEEYYFIICDNDCKEFGTIRIYNITVDFFTWGSWILNTNASPLLGIESALLIYQFAFFYLKLNYSLFDVRKNNNKIVDFHLRFGARITNKDEMNIYFKLTKSDFEEIRIRYSRFISPNVNIIKSEDLMS